MGEGNKILRLTGILLVLAGIITLIIAINAYSNAGKTKDSIKKVQQMASASQSQSGYSTTTTKSAYEPINEWIDKAKNYSMIMIAVSALQIIFGIIGVIMGGKSDNGMLFIGLGGLLLLGAAGVVIYPLIVNEKDYDLAQSFMDLILDYLPGSQKDGITFKLSNNIALLNSGYIS